MGIRANQRAPAAKRDVSRVTFEEVHRQLFPQGPPAPRSLKELKAVIAKRMREKR